jgi:hypothetical protein
MRKPTQITATLAALGLAAVLAGCGSGGGESSPSSSSAQAAKSTSSQAAESTSARPDADNNGIPDAITVKGALGDTLALQGSGLHDNPNDHTKARLRVTLKAVRGPFKNFDVPAGQKLVGVDMRFANVGNVAYDNALPQGRLALSGGGTAKQTTLIPLSGRNPCDDKSLKLASGQAKNVCIAFEIPKTAKPLTFQYVSDYGYGDKAVWTLR